MNGQPKDESSQSGETKEQESDASETQSDYVDTDVLPVLSLEDDGLTLPSTEEEEGRADISDE